MQCNLKIKRILKAILNKDAYICTSELNTDTGECSSLCQFKHGIYVGSKECTQCKYCYGNTIKLITNIKTDSYSLCIVQCSYSGNYFYKFITRLIHIYKKLTNKLIKYKIIYI